MSAAREWITDRLPTAADADSYGDVTVKHRVDVEPSAGPWFHWSMVRPGMAWTHTDIREAPAEPVKAVKPALAVGQRWRRRDGEVVTVDRYDRDHEYGATHPFWADGASYRPDGIFSATGVAGSDLDLVELIEPAAAEPAAEPAAEHTPRRFVLISRTAWVSGMGDRHTLDAIADDGTAWWMVPGETEWHQLPALPDRQDFQ